MLLTVINQRLVFKPLRALSDFTARVASVTSSVARDGQFRAEMATFAGYLNTSGGRTFKKRLLFTGAFDVLSPRPAALVMDFNMIWVNAESCQMLEKQARANLCGAAFQPVFPE